MPGKQPRLTRKEKKAMTSNFISKAKDTNDLLSSMEEWTVYKKRGLDLKIEFSKSKNVNEADMNCVLALLKENMQSMYEKSDWGWNEENKMAELTHEDARYLLVRDSAGKILGFSHFRFDIEVNHPILYCCELQINSEIQRKGVGQHVMNMLTLIAYQFKVVKIVLTVFNDNTAGLNFYMKTLGFRRDETCPYEEEGKCYTILRKSLDKGDVNAIRYK